MRKNVWAAPPQSYTWSALPGISNMTGYSHSCHSIKLIHCGAPKRDALSDGVVSGDSYFSVMLCQCLVIKVSSQSRKSEFRLFSIVHLNIYKV